LIAPNYKDYVSPVALRRLSSILRMGIAAAKECENKVGQPFDAISVGTALGCLTDTEKFLKVINSVEGDILSPTAFIQSTHNTIAGQISLDMGNHSYNMTHTQNNVSFEMALIDGMLCCSEDSKNVLVGAADEAIDFLNLLKPAILPQEAHLTSGATFLVLQPNKNANSIAIKDCSAIKTKRSLHEEIETFLTDNNISKNDIHKVFSNNDELNNQFSDHVNFSEFTGLHYSSSAFGTHMAHDWLLKNANKNVLVVNSGCNENIGLILLSNVKA
jgi:3-oxoacyl-[acyl-carrier-protein] synthase II